MVNNETQREAYLRGFADGAESLTNWISVNDKLPDESEIILAIDTSLSEGNIGWKVVKYCCFTQNRFIHNEMFEKWEDIETDDCVYSATHWMPLPEPPRA